MSTPETPPSAGGDDSGRGLSGVQRAGIVLGGLAVLLIVFVVLRSNGDSGSSSSSSAPRTTAAQGATSTGTGSTGSSSTGTGNGSTSTGSTSTATTPAEADVPTIRVVNGKPDGGIQTVSFKKGDQVAFKVQSDTADEIHVHGYDLKKDVKAGGSVQFGFPASIEGRFEVELENAGVQIANLEVDPA
jgi:hypothetical protein